MSCEDPTNNLASTAASFVKTLTTVENKTSRKLREIVKIWQNFLCDWMQPDTVNLLSEGQSEPAPTSAPVGRSVHRMGCVSSSGS